MSEGWREAEVSPELAGALGYLFALTRTPNAVGSAEVEAALARGTSAGALEQATLMAVLFAYMNRMVDAFGADITPEQAERVAGALDTVGGGLGKLSRARPWERLDGQLPQPLADQLAVIRAGPGDAPAPLRADLEAFVASRSGGRREGTPELPAAVEALAVTMAADAHGVTDAHIADLKADGWSEEAIYEMVFVISFAAGVGRMERSVSVLRGR